MYLRLKRFLSLIMLIVFSALNLLMSTQAWAQDSDKALSKMWLRYEKLDDKKLLKLNSFNQGFAWVGDYSKTAKIACDELKTAFNSFGFKASDCNQSKSPKIYVGTQSNLRKIGIQVNAPSSDNGYLIKNSYFNGRPIYIISAKSEVGVLYGVYNFLRKIDFADESALNFVDAPRIKYRMLNHWDNYDRSVERGYAGISIFNWEELPQAPNPRIEQYARFLASLGINSICLNNVNNIDSRMLSKEWLLKVRKIADIFEPYGIKVFVSIRFTAPIELGHLANADPLNTEVANWWRDKADEIYQIVPNFGGFLVKANSEGQPGPMDYGRTHADGANVLAKALKPHNGLVFWRAFVYNAGGEDRAKQAYTQLFPLDGKFEKNVILQIKNGPIDFQPREPFHPLFTAMQKTNLAMEVQLTKEYLGHSNYVAYLATMWEEVLKSDTGKKGQKIVNILEASNQSAIVGVSNIGMSKNWTGSIFDQSNLYAFGRLAWNPNLSANEIAKEWVKLSLGRNGDFVNKTSKIMMNSREIIVKFMTPLGLTHQMATGHHYGPGPWIKDLHRPEWNPAYYNNATIDGIGFDRSKTGSGAINQYPSELAEKFANPASTPQELILWFHHLSWQYKMKNGKILWHELVGQYDEGVKAAQVQYKDWLALEKYVTKEQFQSISKNFEIEAKEAKWWRDGSLAYFQSVNKLKLPAGARAIEHDLKYYIDYGEKYVPHSINLDE